MTHHLFLVQLVQCVYSCVCQFFTFSLFHFPDSIIFLRFLFINSELLFLSSMKIFSLLEKNANNYLFCCGGENSEWGVCSKNVVPWEN